MSQMMHLVVASILFQITWHFILKNTWTMQDTMKNIEENLWP